jgi:hypothetical protein
VIVGLHGLGLPLREPVGGRRRVLLAQRRLDRGERARGLEEAQRPVKHEHVEEPHQRRMDRVADDREEDHRRQHRRHQRDPGEHSGIAVACVEALRGRQAHAPIERHQRPTPGYRIRVLREETDEDRDEAHAGESERQTRL